MAPEIRTTLHSLEQTITGAKGPVFTDADYGRVLRAFLMVCRAMDRSDGRFRAKAAEAEHIERQRKRELNRLNVGDRLNEILGEWESGSDE